MQAFGRVPMDIDLESCYSEFSLILEEIRFIIMMHPRLTFTVESVFFLIYV